MNAGTASPLWRILNSPLVVLLIGLAAWPVVSGYTQARTAKQSVRTFATEVRNVWNDLKKGGETGEIKAVTSNVVSQVAEGVRSSLQSLGTDQERKLAQFQRLVGAVIVEEITTAHSNFKSQEAWVGRLINGCEHPITGVKLNVIFKNGDGRLIDVKNMWLHEIKTLEPSQSAGIRIERRLGDMNDSEEVIKARRAADLEISVVGFDVVETPD